MRHGRCRFAAEQGRVLSPDAEPEKGFYYRSDHFNFAKKGVPAFDPDSGVDFIDKPAGYGKQKREEYTTRDYHAPSDEIKPDWDLAGAAGAAAPGDLRRLPPLCPARANAPLGRPTAGQESYRTGRSADRRDRHRSRLKALLPPPVGAPTGECGRRPARRHRQGRRRRQSRPPHPGR